MQEMMTKQNELVATLKICLDKLNRLEAREASTGREIHQEANSSGPLGISDVPIYRPQISGSSDKKLKQKVDHFIQQWLGDAVMVNANDTSESQRKKGIPPGDV
ncbi:hypothetical protein A0J61_10892 [Choanephora cucurbitarum]|uniref:Uncharacterized protein n=1 Tax=Choanephora cucurbitarum TaxID=101091 RepID=A0A1C7MXA9_9FUNG|nr:hypothetical protein A0J61_10892 [Choanephora cucurbitarum]